MTRFSSSHWSLAALLGALWAAPAFAANPGSAANALLPFQVNAFQSSRTLRPGDSRAEVYRLAVVNTNVLVGSDQITEITFQNRVIGSGTTAEKDAEWQSLTLIAGKRAVDVKNPAAGSPLATASFSGGTLRFSGLNLNLNPGDSLYVSIGGAPSLAARDLDALDLRIASAASIVTAGGTAVNVTNGGTLDPSGSFPIDGMSAAQLTLATVSTPFFPIGASGQLALAVRIPSNGYSSDRLQSLEIVNRGTAAGGHEIAAMHAWLDDGDATFEPGQEALLGNPVFTGGSWVLGGLSLDIPASSGSWVFVTVDIAETATENLTVQLGIPVLGVAMNSANDGPNDREVVNPVAHVISLIDRVVVSPIALLSGFANPGASDLPLLGLHFTNAYTSPRTLNGLTITNGTAGTGTIAERDAELPALTLRLDGDADGTIDGAFVDPVLATAVFSNGRAFFSGFSIPIDPDAKLGLLVSGDLSLLQSADGDIASAFLEAREDLLFKEAGTALSGGFPLDSDNGWTIDGRIAAQVDVPGAPPRTLAPGDGPVEALDVLVRRNGYLDDVLQSLALVNLGTAGPADLANVRLWKDGGDGAFDGGAGDDQDLGALAFGAGRWTSGALALPLVATGARLFASIVASGAPTDSATVQFAIEAGGLSVASGNDGPLDGLVANPDALLLANRGLLSSLAFGASAITVGQSVALTMTVRSTAAETLLAVVPSAPSFAGTASLSLSSGPAPASRTLAPGESADFVWSYSADSAGTMRATAHATGTGDSTAQSYVSLDAQTAELRVFALADSLSLSVSDAMPQSVTRGQSGVLPLYFTFTHPDSEGSAVRVSGLRVRLEREDGSDVAPASLLSRAVVVQSGDTLLSRTSLESSGATMDLTLATPAIVFGSQPVTLVLGLDVSASTVIPDFRVVLIAAGDVSAEDAATAAPVTVRLSPPLAPVPSGLARVLAAATELDVDSAASAPVRAGRGQLDVTIATFTLQNPGVTGVTTDVRVGALDVKLADSLGARIARPGLRLQRLKLRSGTQTFADRPVAPGADSVVALTLSPLLSVPVNTPVEMRLVADLSDTAAVGPFRLELGDSARFDARDPNTGDRVPAIYARHPLKGGLVTIERRADSLFALGVPHLPSEVAAGARAVQALSVVLRHPGAPGTAALRLNSVAVRCIDGTGAPLVPAPYLDRMQVLWKGALAATLADPPSSGSTMLVPLSGATLEPGDTARVTFVLDFETSAPATSFALALNASGLDASDANLGSAALPVVEDGGEFPLLSGITRITPPSRLLEVDLVDAMPAVIAPDGSQVFAATLRLKNGSSAGSAPIRVNHVIVESSGDSGPVAIGGAILCAALSLAGTPYGTSANLDSDSLTAFVPFASELSLAPGIPVDLELSFTTRTAPGVTKFALAFSASGIGVVQPGNPLLDAAVLPAAGRAFPLATASASYSSASLAGSWSNFPNPFSPAQGSTRFAFFLPAPARVTLEIWTGRGERVYRALDGEPLAAGLHQDISWDGRNGGGSAVQSGVYLAQLTVRFDDGRTERLRRAVAVVR